MDKMVDAAVGMGHTVTAGAITTMGAGVVMLACQMMFFVKMAKLIVMVICFSLVFALLGFLPLCSLCGPEGDTGDVGWIFDLVWAWCRGHDGDAKASSATVGNKVCTVSPASEEQSKP